MHSRCDPPKFDQQDWSQFDFSRWHLDGVNLDAASEAFAGLSEQFFNSAEWRQHFQGTLPDLQREALNFFKDHSRKLEKEKADVAQDFDDRIDAAQKRRQEFQKVVEKAAVPPVIDPVPDTYHLVVRVITADKSSLGLPGLVVQMTDPRNQKVTLVQAVTDKDGNAILTVPFEIASELDRHDTALEVLGPSNKSLVKLASGVCVRLGQTETKVVTIRESAEIEPLKKAALAIRAEQEAHNRNLVARIDRLKKEREARLHALECRIEDNQVIIDGIEQKAAPAARPSEAASEQGAQAKTEPTKEERPPAGKKGRKKA
jgi:hypothetical protein